MIGHKRPLDDFCERRVKPKSNPSRKRTLEPSENFMRKRFCHGNSRNVAIERLVPVILEQQQHYVREHERHKQTVERLGGRLCQYHRKINDLEALLDYKTRELAMTRCQLALALQA